MKAPQRSDWLRPLKGSSGSFIFTLCKMTTIFSGGDGKGIFGEKQGCEAGLLISLREQCVIHQKVPSPHPFSESSWRSYQQTEAGCSPGGDLPQEKEM